VCKAAVYSGGSFGVCVEPEHPDEKEVDVYQLAYLAKKGRAAVRSPDGKTLSWFEVIERYSKEEPRAWVMFSVYYDLTERGRVVKVGPHREGFTLYKGGKPVANVLVLEETTQLRISELVEQLERSMKQGRGLIAAIVDKHGDVSYYTIEAFG